MLVLTYKGHREKKIFKWTNKVVSKVFCASIACKKTSTKTKCLRALSNP